VQRQPPRPGGLPWQQPSENEGPPKAGTRPVPGAHVAADRPRVRRGRVAVIATLVGLVAAVAGGIGSYAVAAGAAPEIGPVKCDGSGLTCVPKLRAATVIDRLKARGHSCQRGADRWTCALRIGVTEYTFSLFEVSGQVRSYSAHVSTVEVGPTDNASSPPSSTSMGYLSWSAQLPYSHDPEFAAQIRTWLGRQVKTGGTTVADVGGYTYKVDASKPQEFNLDVEAVKPE
jgi:hypothetical protein